MNLSSRDGFQPPGICSSESLDLCQGTTFSRADSCFIYWSESAFSRRHSSGLASFQYSVQPLERTHNQAHVPMPGAPLLFRFDAMC